MKAILLGASVLLSSAALAQTTDMATPPATLPGSAATPPEAPLPPDGMADPANPPMGTNADMAPGLATGDPSAAPATPSSDAAAADASGMTTRSDQLGTAPAPQTPAAAPVGMGGPNPPEMRGEYPRCSRTVADSCTQAPGATAPRR